MASPAAAAAAASAASTASARPFCRKPPRLPGAQARTTVSTMVTSRLMRQESAPVSRRARKRSSQYQLPRIVPAVRDGERCGNAFTHCSRIIILASTRLQCFHRFTVFRDFSRQKKSTMFKTRALGNRYTDNWPPTPRAKKTSDGQAGPACSGGDSGGCSLYERPFSSALIYPLAIR